MKIGNHKFRHSRFDSYYHIRQQITYSKIRIHSIHNYLIVVDYETNHNHFEIRSIHTRDYYF
jgi:hypothetical protein